MHMAGLNKSEETRAVETPLSGSYRNHSSNLLLSRINLMLHSRFYNLRPAVHQVTLLGRILYSLR